MSYKTHEYAGIKVVRRTTSEGKPLPSFEARVRLTDGHIQTLHRRLAGYCTSMKEVVQAIHDDIDHYLFRLECVHADQTNL
jgi:hypothetical protein